MAASVYSSTLASTQFLEFTMYADSLMMEFSGKEDRSRRRGAPTGGGAAERVRPAAAGLRGFHPMTRRGEASALADQVGPDPSRRGHTISAD